MDTVAVAVGGGLFAGVATAAQHHGIRAVAVEPQNCRALNTALQAGRCIDVTVDFIAADSLGARRTSAMALHAAQQDRVHSVPARDEEIVRARQALWEHRKEAVEHGAATAPAALSSPGQHVDRDLQGRSKVPSRSYRAASGERVCVVLCGANTDPIDLIEDRRVPRDAHRPQEPAALDAALRPGRRRIRRPLT